MGLSNFYLFNQSKWLLYYCFEALLKPWYIFSTFSIVLTKAKTPWELGGATSYWAWGQEPEMAVCRIWTLFILKHFCVDVALLFCYRVLLPHTVVSFLVLLWSPKVSSIHFPRHLIGFPNIYGIAPPCTTSCPIQLLPLVLLISTLNVWRWSDHASWINYWWLPDVCGFLWASGLSFSNFDDHVHSYHRQKYRDGTACYYSFHLLLPRCYEVTSCRVEMNPTHSSWYLSCSVHSYASVLLVLTCVPFAFAKASHSTDRYFDLYHGVELCDDSGVFYASWKMETPHFWKYMSKLWLSDM